MAEVSKKTGIRKKAVRVRAYRYRQLGIPLRVFPPVELPDWDQLAEYARSLLPAGAVSTSVGRRDEDEEDRKTHRISRNQDRLPLVNRHQNSRPCPNSVHVHEGCHCV